MYCRKSNMRCLVYHSDGMCPDITDCEACKLENGNFPNLEKLYETPRTGN